MSSLLFSRARWNKKAPPAHVKFFIRDSHPEILEVQFEKSVTEYIITIRCSKHLHCDCGIDRMMKLITAVRRSFPNCSRIFKLGKIISYKRLITRIDYVSNKITTYGYVDESNEISYFDGLKSNGRKDRKLLFKKYGHLINCPFEAIPKEEELNYAPTIEEIHGI